MLDNDPPPGTPVRFLTEVRKARRGNVGKLVRPLRTYYVERPDDEFEVSFEGEIIVVKRSEIEKSA